MFVRWECGCVGIPGTPQAVVVEACDADRDAPADSLTWAMRNMGDKISHPLVPHSEKLLHRNIANRLHRADRFDTARQALGIAEERSPFV